MEIISSLSIVFRLTGLFFVPNWLIRQTQPKMARPNLYYPEMKLGASVTRFGDLFDFGPLLKPLATINLPKSPTFLGNFCKGVKIYHFF